MGLRVVVDREVTDSGPGFESRPRRPEHEKGSGWVLHLVEHVPNRWGTTRTRRPCVWFEIDLEGDDRADGAAPTAGQGASEGVHAA